jgi:ribosomal protein L30/L7E
MMRESQNGADLVQYVAAVSLMRSAIPNYSKRVAPPQEALVKVVEGKSRRTKKAAATMSLLHLRRTGDQTEFKDLQAAIIVNDVGFFRPRQEHLCLDGCLR